MKILHWLQNEINLISYFFATKFLSAKFKIQNLTDAIEY